MTWLRQTCFALCSLLLLGFSMSASASLVRVSATSFALSATAYQAQPLWLLGVAVRHNGLVTVHVYAGNLTQLTDPNTGITHYTYNDRGEVTQVVTDFGAFSKTQTYAYHPDGKLKRYTTPEGISYHYGYNPNNALEVVHLPNQGQLVYTDHQWNLPSRIIYPGGSQQLTERNGFQQPVSQQLTNSLQQLVHQAIYGYEAEGHLTQIDEPHRTQHMNYDSGYRLTDYHSQYTDNGIDDKDTQHQYHYDGVDNRIALSKTQEGDDSGTNNNSDSDSWLYQHNRLIEANGHTYEYDANGSLITIINKASNATLQTLSYNAQQRLSQFTQNGITTTYTYDPTGTFRLSKSNATGTTYYLYNQNGLAAEYDANGNLKIEYHFAPQAGWGMQPMFTRQNGQYYYYQLDYRNAPTRIIDAGGNILWQADYDDFGNAHISKPDYSSVENNLRLPGQYADQESGYYYNLNRYYAPELGRYLTEDPIGLEGGINLYSYVNQSPHNYVDTTGENPAAAYAYGRCVLQCKAVGAAVGAITGCESPSIGDCALSCLNPMSWLGGGKGGKAPRSGIRGTAKSQYTNKHAREAALKNGYVEKGSNSHGPIYHNPKANPPWIGKSETGHKGEMFKGYANQKQAEIGRKSKDSRFGSYDSNMNRVGD